MEAIDNTIKPVSVKEAGSSHAGDSIAASPPKQKFKEIEVFAAREFTTLPKKVQSETRTRIGAFAEPEQLTAYRSLSDSEIKAFGLGIIGTSANSPNYTDKILDYFNEYDVVVPYDEPKKLRVPIDEKGEAVLNASTARYITDIMAYRHVMKHPRVAPSYASYQEMPMFYVGYIVDRRILREESISGKNVRKQADRNYLILTSEKNVTKLDWVLEVARKGIYTGNLNDPETGYVPSTLMGVRRIDDLLVDEKELAMEEFKNQRPDEFVKLVTDTDLEWKALLEKLIINNIFVREGNVILHKREVVGGNDEQAVAKLKTEDFAEKLVVAKQELENALKDNR